MTTGTVFTLTLLAQAPLLPVDSFAVDHVRYDVRAPYRPQDSLPLTPSAVASSPSHRFFDAPNLALTVVESTALVADGIYTQRALTDYPEIFREADPIARPFVSRGWPGQIAGGALFVTAEVGLRYWLHRKRHHRIERLLPLVLTVYGTVGAVHGARELRRAAREGWPSR